MDSHLSPAETAKRFGISIKALRLYEQHGLLQPLRTANGSTGAAWRAYGLDQIARLHQILALKRLGLSLGQMGELLAGAEPWSLFNPAVHDSHYAALRQVMQSKHLPH